MKGGSRKGHQKKDDCTTPMVCVSQPNCLDMGSTAMLMLTRSMLHSMKAKKQRATMVQRRFQRGGALTTCQQEGFWM